MGRHPRRPRGGDPGRSSALTAPARDAAFERELKLALDASGYARLASSLSGARASRWLANHYFDQDGALLSQGAMLRVRETAESRVACLKQGGSSVPGMFEAVEREEPVSDADWSAVVRAGGDLVVLDLPVVHEARALSGARALPLVGTLRVLRRTYRFAPGADLELDLACYDDGSQDWELEVETDRPAALRADLVELLERAGVPWEVQRRTKYERFLASPTADRIPLCASREECTLSVTGDLEVRAHPLHGAGVFAARDFTGGETVLTFDGPEVTATLPPQRGRQFVQVRPRSWIDLSGTAARHVRHSCIPTAGIRGTRTLVALRPIRRGEELTYDYATTEEELDLVCCCGTPACRGLIGGWRRLPSDVRRRHASHVSDYLREAPSLARGTG